MYTYPNLKKAIESSFKHLLQFGGTVKAGKWQGTDKFANENMLVLINHNFVSPVPETEKELISLTTPDVNWVRMHFQERVSGVPSNPGESYKVWPYNTFKEVGDDFKKELGLFSHTYMERFWPSKTENIKGVRFPIGDLSNIIYQLRENPLTRQAYLPIFFPEDTVAAEQGERVPCTLGYHFFVWDNKLHVNYYIRSCDAYRHFKNDIYLTARLLQYISAESGINSVGNIYMFVANFHTFKNDVYNLCKREPYLKSL